MDHRLIRHGRRLPFTWSPHPHPHPYPHPPGGPRPRFSCLHARLWCGVPKASGKHSLQYSHSGGHQMGPLRPPRLLSDWGFSLPMMLSGSGFRKKRGAGPCFQTIPCRGALPLWSASKIPSPPSPHADQGIFSEAENPSHEQSSSTEVIKHGWFVVIGLVILPWPDPQTLKPALLQKNEKIKLKKLETFCCGV